MGEPATPPATERLETRKLAFAIVDSVRNDEAMPLDVRYWTSQLPDHIANALETRCFQLAQEIELLSIERNAFAETFKEIHRE